MPTIEIDDEVWRRLQREAVPFVDTPNDVIRRFLGLAKRTQRDDVPKSTAVDLPQESNSQQEVNYTDHRIRGFRLRGRFIRCRTFKELLLNVSNELRGQDQTAFDRVALGLHGRKRTYFSKSDGDLKFAEQLTGRGLYVETNLNANLIVKICHDLIQGLGIKPDDFIIESGL